MNSLTKKKNALCLCVHSSILVHNPSQQTLWDSYVELLLSSLVCNPTPKLQLYHDKEYTANIPKLSVTARAGELLGRNSPQVL